LEMMEATPRQPTSLAGIDTVLALTHQQNELMNPRGNGVAYSRLKREFHLDLSGPPFKLARRLKRHLSL
jgi:hypothetical protein